jgi:hypothetical protein
MKNHIYLYNKNAVSFKRIFSRIAVEKVIILKILLTIFHTFPFMIFFYTPY